MGGLLFSSAHGTDAADPEAVLSVCISCAVKNFSCIKAFNLDCSAITTSGNLMVPVVWVVFPFVGFFIELILAFTRAKQILSPGDL